MTTTTPGNGNGRARGPAGTTVIDPAELSALDAPARLARALAVTGLDIPAAQRLLRSAGYKVSITGGRNDEADGDGDGSFAAHPVNVSAAGFSYSAKGTPGHEECCATRTRGVYQGTRLAAKLPYVWSRLITSDGRADLPSWTMSAAPGGRPVLVTWDDIDRGKLPYRLNMPRSKDNRIRDAIETAVDELCYDPAVTERPASLTPSARTPDGRIPAPAWETLPPGYGDQPTTPEADRLAARAVQAEIAARCPQIALAWGASVAGPFAAALRVQGGTWELVAPPRLGKTTTMQLLAAAWGAPFLPPDAGILVSWDATEKGMSRLHGVLGILPSFADETGTADFAPAEWARYHYGHGQGSSRLLANQTGLGMTKTPGWQGFSFATGNGSTTDRITSGKYAGIPARVITLTGPFTATADDSRHLRAAVEADYGYMGPAVLEAFTVEDMRAMHRAALEASGAPDGGILGTTGEQLAVAVAGAVALDRVLGTGNRLGAAAMRAARDYLGTASEPEPDHAAVLRALAECLSADRPAWPSRDAYTATGEAADFTPGAGPSRIPRHGVAPGLAGVTEGEWVYVFPRTWRSLVDETGVTERTVLQDLFSRGDLAVPETRRARGEWTSAAPRWANRAPSYKIRLSALPGRADVDGPDVDGPDGPADVDGTTAAYIPIGELGKLEHGPGEHDVDGQDDAGMGWGPGTIEEAVNATPAAPEIGHRVADLDGRRAAWLAAANQRMSKWTDSQRAAFNQRAALLDADDIEDNPGRLRILAALEGQQDNSEARRGRVTPGPFAPRRANRAPWWRPWGKDGIPPAVQNARVISAWAWERGYTGQALALDRSGAWVAGLASATFAHGALAPTGPWDGEGTPRPGYYLVDVYPWTETGMPSPLSNTTPGQQVWIPAPTMGLLRDLANAGRWPHAVAVDSVTGDPCRLSEWAGLMRELRNYAIEVHGRDSGAYGAVKQGIGMSLSLLKGSWAEDTTLPRKTWKCIAQRLDWPDHAETQAAVTMWRIADECRQLADLAGTPDLAPVAVGRNTDELVIPAAALDLVTTGILPGRNRPPVKIDPAGTVLGTFKVKKTEDW